MNNRQFIAKQRVKYIWKTLKRSDRITGNAFRDTEGRTGTPFWEYEQIPRKV